MQLKGRNFLKLMDYTPEEITYLIDLSQELKEKKKKGIRHDDLTGKNIALIFEKTSTRTRCSFEVAAHDLGMHVTYLDPSGSQIGKKESIADTARVLGRMFDGIEYRGYGQEIVEELAKYAGVPVWNGLTNEFHPTQMIADMLTIREHLGRLKGVKFVYMGDARYNMGNSLMVTCAKLGMDFVACTNKKYFPNDELVKYCKDVAETTGASITLTEDVAEGTKDADVIYTDVWVSMGEPEDVWAERIRELSPYQVNAELMKKAKYVFFGFEPVPREAVFEKSVALYGQYDSFQKVDFYSLLQDGEILYLYTQTVGGEENRCNAVFEVSRWTFDRLNRLLGE